MADQSAPTADKAEPTNPEPTNVEQAQSSQDVKTEEQAKSEERTVPYSRFSEVNSKLKALEDEKAANEKKQLEEQGKWEELAKANEAKATAADTRAREALIQSNVVSEASKLGIVDPDAASKLLNRTKVEVAEDGTVTGVEDALKQLVEDKPYLVAKDSATPTRIGSGSNPGAEGNQSPTESTFKKSQLSDPKFYKEHRSEILKAVKEGRVIDDSK